MELTVLAMPDMLLPMPTTERGPLMPSPRLMPTTMELTLTVLAMAMVPMVLAMPDTLLPTPTTERGPLMLSPRLMLMPTTMELTVLAMAMVVSMVDTDTGLMVPTPMVLMPTASKMSSQTQIRVAHQVQTEAQKQTKSRSNLTFSAINSFVI